MRTFALLTVAALAVAGCHREPEAPPPRENIVEEPLLAPAPEPLPVAPPPATNTANSAKAEPAPTVSEDAQMRDDAAATGMTARLPDDAPPADAANETRPAQ